VHPRSRQLALLSDYSLSIAGNGSVHTIQALHARLVQLHTPDVDIDTAYEFGFRVLKSENTKPLVH
jgi:hypothetical protein